MQFTKTFMILVCLLCGVIGYTLGWTQVDDPALIVTREVELILMELPPPVRVRGSVFVDYSEVLIPCPPLN